MPLTTIAQRSLVTLLSSALLVAAAGACSSGPKPGTQGAACSAAGDCNSGLSCDGNKCEPIVVSTNCNSDLDCDSNEFCDQASGACVANGSEAVGAYCNDDRDCDAGDACDPATGLCVTPA